jgi:hypothetical protein
MPKLTLSVKHDVVERAKRFADRHGTSVSRLVERFLDQVTRHPDQAETPPVLHRLRGSLKGSDSAAYRRHLKEKYR